MQQLAEREEQIMRIIWNRGQAFIKEVLEDIPDPKPHYNTIATIIKILEKKGFLTSVKFGNSYRYSPAISFEEYRHKYLAKIKKNFFSNSFSKLVAHFAKEENLSQEEVQDIVDSIKNKRTS